MEQYKQQREILCIDLKSFFASVECALRGLDPFQTPLIVADKSRGNGSIVLAVTPYLKARGLKSRFRLHDLPDNIQGLVVAKPRMQAYLAYSKKVIEVYLEFIASEDLHIYSIDEAFLDVTSYLKYYQCDAETLAERILQRILEVTKVPATCGVGDNLLLSKLALDLYSKKSPTGIATMRYHDVPQMLWPLKPLSEMWGIGSRMEKRLNYLNIYSVYDLAHTSIDQLKKLFGVIGEELYYHAHGIDQSVIREKNYYHIPMKSVGLGQTLYKDYHGDEIMIILLEMVDEVAERLRFVRKEAHTIHLSMRYSKAYGGGFSRQITFDVASCDVEDLLDAVLRLFHRFYEGYPIRQVFIRATKLKAYHPAWQASFFSDVIRKEKRQKLWESIDLIRQRHGKSSVARLVSFLESGTAIERATLIGGHHG